MKPVYCDRRDAAHYLTEQRGLKTSWRTLQKFATIGGGPPYRRYGNRAVYTKIDLDEWADAKLSAVHFSTSDLVHRSEKTSHPKTSTQTKRAVTGKVKHES